MTVLEEIWQDVLGLLIIVLFIFWGYLRYTKGTVQDTWKEIKQMRERGDL